MTLATFVAFILYFINPRKLIQDSFRGHLRICNVNLSKNITDEIAEGLFQTYTEKKKINSAFGRGMKSNLDFMSNLVMGEAYYIKQLLDKNTKEIPFSRHEKTIKVLEHAGITLYGIKD